ncbi:MAG: hypothetical protein V4490_01580 [Pseudomonadota bacterium]
MDNLTLRHVTIFQPDGTQTAAQDCQIVTGKFAQIHAAKHTQKDTSSPTSADVEGAWLLPLLWDIAPQRTFAKSELQFAPSLGIGHAGCQRQLQCTRFDTGHTATVYPIAPLLTFSAGSNRPTPADTLALKKSGHVGLSLAYSDVIHWDACHIAFLWAAQAGLRVFVDHLSQVGNRHPSLRCEQLGIPTCSAHAEEFAVYQLLSLAEKTGCTLHLGNLSSARAVALLGDAQQRGVNATGGVAIQHLFFEDGDCLDFDSRFHECPPYRTLNGRNTLRTGLKDGVLSVISANHRPLPLSVKDTPYTQSAPGSSTWDIYLNLAIKLIREEILPAQCVIPALTKNPAALLGQQSELIQEGSAAQFILIHPERGGIVSPERWLSAGKNTPLTGSHLPGQRIGIYHQAWHELVK